MNIKEIKDIFVMPKKKYYLGKLKHGTPYMHPPGFKSNIISIRKLNLTTQEELDKLPNDLLRNIKKYSNIPTVRRCKHWIIKFNNEYFVEIGSPIKIYRNSLRWKDKFNSPRFEFSPAFYFYFFKWQFCIWWNAPDGDNDRYYEMILWWLEYCDKDIIKAEKTWGWSRDGESTWNKKYVIDTLQKRRDKILSNIIK